MLKGGKGKGQKASRGAEVNFLMNLANGKEVLEKIAQWQFKGNFKSQLKHFPSLSPVTLLNAFLNSACLSLAFMAGKQTKTRDVSCKARLCPLLQQLFGIAAACCVWLQRLQPPAPTQGNTKITK